MVPKINFEGMFQLTLICLERVIVIENELLRNVWANVPVFDSVIATENQLLRNF